LLYVALHCSKLLRFALRCLALLYIALLYVAYFCFMLLRFALLA